jgi:uncharacterized membrane protein YeaQ/YmgE (transglycosylase-associated protein family)
MGFIAWIVVGIIAGWLAKFVIRGTGPGGALGDLLIGVIGAVLGGWIWNWFGHVGATGINIPSIIVAFVGSVILLFVSRGLSQRTA